MGTIQAFGIKTVENSLLSEDGALGVSDSVVVVKEVWAPSDVLNEGVGIV